MPRKRKDSSVRTSKEDAIRFLDSKVKQTAHDLNNIITSSKNSIATIKQVAKLDDEIQKHLTNVETNCIRATEIIEELLASEGIGKRTKRRINVDDLINEVVRTLRGSIGKNIHLDVKVGKKLSKIEGFYSDLYRAFLNIALNSFESISEKGKISLKVRNIIIKPSNRAIEISIKDNGCGISRKDLSSIFKDGYSTKEKKVTSGLGLFIVKNIIEAHNGYISVNSELGKGSEFVVTLPAIVSTKKALQKNKIKKVLIAEDEVPILESISYLLESYNYNTLCAANGIVAIEKYEANQDVDLMIIDKLMPGLDGLEVIQKIRSKNKRIPIFLTTGIQDINDKELSKLGINKIIKKPYDFELMIELIRGISL
ncbi:MAG: hybrid sensor histidine kinase/response regulator [Bacteroidota bacterium]